MIRVEFEINKPKEIEKKFGNTNLFALKQDDLNKVFSSMATELIKKPLKKYYHEMDIAFDKYFEKLDIVGHRSSWRKQVLVDLGNLVEETDGYLVIPYEDLRRYVKSINAPSIYKNCARITKELAKAFNDSQATGIRVTSEDIVELIVEWLTNPEEGPLLLSAG